VRAVAAGVGGLVGAWLLGLVLIPWLERLKLGQVIREAGPERHLTKRGTPTMGGCLFLIPLPLLAGMLAPRALSAWALVFLTWAFGLIGFADDYRKVVGQRSLGLRAREKLLLQLAVATVFVWAANGQGATAYARLPFGLPTLPGGPWLAVLAVVAIVASANAVNLTDGLDGLAAGASAIGIGFLAALAATTGQEPELVVALALVGGLVGFLRWNLHPARIFMGDTGSLALGAAFAGLGYLTHAVLYLPVVGVLFVVETLSVIVQVIGYRLWGRRLLRMSPLHHHYELAGWSEERVVAVFWLVAVVGALAAWI
jgi:phospho-N-acetylmuramoyl-pentapeptide-transferase